MKTEKYDLAVIGAGPGGYVASIRAAQLGLKVACIEKEPQLGGTCLRVGCIPSKALLESSDRFGDLRKRMARHGIDIDGVSLNLGKMMKRKTQVVDTLAKGIAGLLKKNKITRYTGAAEFQSAKKLVVKGDDSVALEAKHILIATGSRSADLKGVKLDGDRVGTSTEALSYPDVPGHLIVIGAGYIGLELGSVWRRLGAQVTVLEYLDRILPGMDNEIATEAQKLFERQGLKFQLGSKVTSAKAQGTKCTVGVAGADPLEGDRVLLAVGRIPNTEGLALEKAGIQPDGHGRIPVNDKFQTDIEGIHAIGDVIRGPMLAHKAEEEGVACAEIIATGHGHVDYNTIPGVAYTDPEIATVGRTEEQLKEAGADYRKGVFYFRANGRALAAGSAEGKVKMLADQRTDRVLGVHIIGPHAGELISEAASAMSYGASSEDIARTCHAHPTLAETLKEAALEVDGRAIHS